MKLTNKLTLLAGLVASVFAINANAGIVTNATDTLTGTGHAQLSEWLGEDVDLTRIFAKGVDGSTSQDWHSAVDGKGRTFTVMEVITNSGRLVIGGYNDLNWSSDERWGVSKERKNFLFNLTSGARYAINNGPSGYYQTYNRASNGAYFTGYYGGGDLSVYQDLSHGSQNIGYTYGDYSRRTTPDYKEEFIGSTEKRFRIGAYETYVLSNSTGDFGSGANALLSESGLPNDVPVPFALAGLSLLGLGFARRKQAKH